MKTLHTKLALSALGIALLATPAFAQKPHRQAAHQAPQYQSVQGHGVVVDGRVIGADPDAQIRGELSRDAANSLGAY